MHKKVQIVVFNIVNEKTQVLLLQTNKRRDSFWQNATGSVEPNESSIEGAKRELLEETGIKGELHQSKLVFNFHDRWERDVSEKVYYNISYNLKEADIEIDPSEHQSFKWLDTDLVNESTYKYQNNYEAYLHCLKLV